jgi:hypothetical protein
MGGFHIAARNIPRRRRPPTGARSAAEIACRGEDIDYARCTKGVIPDHSAFSSLLIGGVAIAFGGEVLVDSSTIITRGCGGHPAN